MKRNKNFIKREVAGKQVAVPVGKAAASFPGMITLNETASLLWELLEQEQTEETLIAALRERYDVSEEQALADIRAFAEKLQKIGALE